MAGKRYHNQQCRVREVRLFIRSRESVVCRRRKGEVLMMMMAFGSAVEAGKHVEFKGTDLLTIDLGSRKVMNATTSSDLLNYYRELGYPLGVWSANSSDASVSA